MALEKSGLHIRQNQFQIPAPPLSNYVPLGMLGRLSGPLSPPLVRWVYDGSYCTGLWGTLDSKVDGASSALSVSLRCHYYYRSVVGLTLAQGREVQQALGCGGGMETEQVSPTPAWAHDGIGPCTAGSIELRKGDGTHLSMLGIALLAVGHPALP